MTSPLPLLRPSPARPRGPQTTVLRKAEHRRFSRKPYSPGDVRVECRATQIGEGFQLAGNGLRRLSGLRFGQNELPDQSPYLPPRPDASHIHTPAMTTIRKICCIGAGYVGGPTMAMIALKCPHIEARAAARGPELRPWPAAARAVRSLGRCGAGRRLSAAFCPGRGVRARAWTDLHAPGMPQQVVVVDISQPRIGEPATCARARPASDLTVWLQVLARQPLTAPAARRRVEQPEPAHLRAAPGRCGHPGPRCAPMGGEAYFSMWPPRSRAPPAPPVPHARARCWNRLCGSPPCAAPRLRR